jgi:DNA polymerase III epsilon subunit-like protein
MDDHLLRFDKDKVYTFIDFETCNLCLNFCHNLPWQVGMIKSVNGKKIDEKDFYIKWPDDIKVSKEAARITRFDMKKYLMRAIPYDEIFPTMEDWMNNADYILGHNILGFDIYLIKEYYKSMGKDYKHLLPKIIDTMCIARGVKCGISYKEGDDFLAYQYKMLHERRKGMKTSLIALGKEFDIKHNYAMLHDAVVDLELNLKVWNKIKWMMEI